MTPSTLLHGSRVRLTALTQSDLPTIIQWHQNPAFLRLFDVLPAYPRTEAAFAQWLDDTHKATDAFLFAIRTLDSDPLIGYVELDGILWTHRVSGVSIAIGEAKHWGKGYGYEVIQLALRFAFDELNLHRVQLTVFCYNKRAIALYEKLGFQREGIHREHLQRDGERYDMYLYGLLRSEWEERSSIPLG